MAEGQTTASNPLWNFDTFQEFDKIEEDDDIDIDKHRAFIGEIKRDASLGRLTLMVTDGKRGSERTIPVAFYDDSNGAIWLPLVKVGHSIMILYPGSKKHVFLDGQEGFRIDEEDMKHVRIFPCNYMTLLAASDLYYSLTTKPKQCQSCFAEPNLSPSNRDDDPSVAEKDKKLLSCGRCRVIKYCNKDCQTLHWPQHKKDCRPLAEVQWITRRDWDTVERTPDGKTVLFEFV